MISFEANAPIRPEIETLALEEKEGVDGYFLTLHYIFLRNYLSLSSSLSFISQNLTPIPDERYQNSFIPRRDESD
jgi:hypothetical protein